jgi:hypothetical protein
MPLFHLHTFLFVSLVFALWALASGRMREWVPVVAWAVLPASWLTYEVTNGFRAASLVWWNPGWTIAGAPLAPFVALNFTLFLPLFVGAAFLAYRARDKDGLLTLIPGLALFATLFFVMLAPWEWDNTKVMIWCYVLMLPAAERLVIAPLPAVARVAALLALFAPGLVTIAGTLGPQQAFEVGETAEIADVCYTAGVGRNHFEQRAGLVVDSRERTHELLGALADDRSLSGLFSGTCTDPPSQTAVTSRPSVWFTSGA